MSAISLLARHLTPANHEELASLATHKSKRTIEKMLAERFPKPDVAPRVRRLPGRVPRNTPAQSSSEGELNRSCATDVLARPERSDRGGNGNSSAADAPEPRERSEPTAAAENAAPQDVRAAQPKLSPGLVEPRSVERYKVTFLLAEVSRRRRTWSCGVGLTMRLLPRRIMVLSSWLAEQAIVFENPRHSIER